MEKWDTAAVVADALSAQVLLGRLLSEGLPARVQSDTALLGAARQCRILVPAGLLHRAKYVLWETQFTEEELAFLATGELSGESPAR